MIFVKNDDLLFMLIRNCTYVLLPCHTINQCLIQLNDVHELWNLYVIFSDIPSQTSLVPPLFWRSFADLPLVVTLWYITSTVVSHGSLCLTNSPFSLLTKGYTMGNIKDSLKGVINRNTMWLVLIFLSTTQRSIYFNWQQIAIETTYHYMVESPFSNRCSNILNW